MIDDCRDDTAVQFTVGPHVLEAVHIEVFSIREIGGLQRFYRVEDIELAGGARVAVASAPTEQVRALGGIVVLESDGIVLKYRP